jgi:cytochrome P450/NADPH-cytochrome P450 reductase
MEIVREYGPMVRLRTPIGDRFVASGLPMIDDLCDDERFDKLVGDGQKAVRAFGRSSGLFTSDTDDPNWAKAHNILLPNFSMQAMRDYVPMMNDIASQLMQKWERLNPGELVDVTADTTRLTLDTIALCGFGYRFNSFYRDTQHPFVGRHDAHAAGKPDSSSSIAHAGSAAPRGHPSAPGKLSVHGERSLQDHRRAPSDRQR